MLPDPHQFLPRHKSDIERARAAVALGYPAVAPILPDLLEWLQDCNWPISRPIGDFLASIPEAVAPHIWNVLRGDDLIWKYWCIVRLISTMPSHVAEQFRAELTRLSEQPAPREREEELDEVAAEALQSIWPSGGA